MVADSEVAAGGRAASAERRPRWARAFAALFISVFVACGVFGIEAWPLTGWRLFSNLRAPQQISWQAVSLDAAGQEQPIPFTRLPRGYRNFSLIMRDFPSLSVGDQAALCERWADAVRQLGRSVTGVRIYRVERDVSRREPRNGVRRILRHTCAAPGESTS